MSQAAIQTIRGVEDAMDRQRAEAKAKAQKILADAEKEGRALLEQERAAAAAKTAEVMEAAGRQAEKRRAQILADTNRECRSITTDAQDRLSEAAGMIVRRVVER